jgi:hypothetical protein
MPEFRGNAKIRFAARVLAMAIATDCDRISGELGDLPE